MQPQLVWPLEMSLGVPYRNPSNITFREAWVRPLVNLNPSVLVEDAIIEDAIIVSVGNARMVKRQWYRYKQTEIYTCN